MAKPATGASRQSSLAVDREGERAKRLLAAADAYMKVKRGQPQPSIPAVAREHGVPYATLYRVIKRGGVIAKRGRPTALSAVQEEQLRDLVVRGQQQGVGVTKTALLAAVRTTQRVMGRKGKVDPFKGNAPGKRWRQGFMRRQGLSLRKATPVTKNRRMAATNINGLGEWFEGTWQPALSRVCVSKDAAGRRVQPQTYKQRPDRIFNMDETGFQAECHERVLATTSAKHVFQSAASNSRRSYTCVAWGSADGCVMPPNFVYAGKQLSHNALGAIHFYPQSSIILKEGTHMMDGRLFPKLLDVMAKQIPGGVSPTNRALLVLDGHASRFSNDTKEAARVHGFDLVILPAQCTSFLQPWDQLFGSVKAHYQKLLGHAAFLAGAEGFNPSPSQIISLVDTAMHYSVGFSMQPLQRAFEKTGLYPPNKDNMLAAAASSVEGGKQQPAFKPWIPLAVDDAMLRVAAQRSAQPQPSLRFPAEDRFYFKHEVVAEAAKKAAKARKGSCK
ncbi:hypothetical protein QJQ45_001147 [Haematococcus lacustris]|nr:hypothetical protein QJQ45_001147 [Haematococcus lacustris]